MIKEPVQKASNVLSLLFTTMKKARVTLLEIIVLSATLLVFAAAALPALDGAIEASYATRDFDNLRHLGIGMLSYLNDNHNMMFSRNAATTWPVELQDKYLADWRTFESPFDGRPFPNAAPYPVSYGINENLYAPDGRDLGENSTAPVYLGFTWQIVSASELILVAPVPQRTTTTSFNTNSSQNVTLTVPQRFPEYGTHKNRGMINALYADFHVSAVPWATFAEKDSPDGLRRWYPFGMKPKGKEFFTTARCNLFLIVGTLILAFFILNKFFEIGVNFRRKDKPSSARNKEKQS